jgi:hypothetical protein
VIGVVVAFIVFNLQEWLGGRWELGDSPSMAPEDIRKVIGLFAIVQGFAAEHRITTMRGAQIISTVVFVGF